MHITTIQSSLQWENISGNLAHFESILHAISEQTNLIVLPEMFTTGFSMNPEKTAEPTEGRTLAWMQKMAAMKDAAIIGSSMVTDHGNFYNRLFFVFPDGNYKYYDKKHLFSLAGEHLHYTAGTERLIVNWRGWRICPLVCYDLRFPEWSRNNEAYDLLIYTANWPKPRANAWKSLLVARAIENQCYTVGVNIVGNDANNNQYQGDTSITDYQGVTIYSALDAPLASTTTLLDKDAMQQFRQKFPFLQDMDRFVSNIISK